MADVSKRGAIEDTSALGLIVNRINQLEARQATFERNAERGVPPEGFRWDPDISQGPALRRISDNKIFRLTEVPDG